MFTWNNRVIKHTHKDGEVWLAIHEVHSGDTGLCELHTVDPVSVTGETVEDLRETLHRMLRCLDKPVLDENDVVGHPM